jgi:hypothetical protein
MVAELVLDDQFTAVDLATPDPATIKFRRKRDDVLGVVWEMGQWQNNEWVPLDRPTIRYIPIDPMPGKPYGRSPMMPALFPALFLLGFYQDLKRVIANQGYPRIDIAVKVEPIYKLLTGGDPKKEAELSPEKVQSVLKNLTDSTIAAFNSVKPGDTYIHPDLVEVNQPVGAMGANSLGMVQSIIESLERMCIRGIKTISLLFGVADGVGEANANRQWEIHVAGIKNVQHLAENLIESEYEILLQAAGFMADVEMRFAELRAAEEFRDQQTLTAKIANYMQLMDRGMITPNAAAEELLGYVSDAVALSYDDPDGSAVPLGEPEPEPTPTGGNDDGTGTSTDGAEEDENTTALSRMRTQRDGTAGDADSEPIRETEIDEAIAWFDTEEPEYAGILEATILNDGDEVDRATIAEFYRAAGGEGSVRWGYETSTRKYKNLDTDKYVHGNSINAVRNRVSTAASGEIDDLLTGFYNGDITSAQLRMYGERAIKQGQISNYLLGRGGRNMMQQSDWGRVGYLTKKQYGHWRSFVNDVSQGSITEAQARARGSMYGGCTTESYERGRATSFGVEGSLPTYPGQQSCMSNCRCRWSLTEKEDRVEAKWIRSGGADSCEDCKENATNYNPYVIMR